jgi:ABC-2 type transport system permease protein
MIITVARKEFIEMIRDGRFRLAGTIVFALLVLALLTGWKRFVEVSREHRVALQTQRDLWLGQGAKNPHSAAHYGYYVFKPQLPLGVLDQGLDPYLGVALFLEAHKQNRASYRPAEEATPVQRFGELTAAAALQGLVPLLIVLLAFATFAGEREQRTLRQLLSLGGERRKLALGKALGVAAPLLVLLIPAAAVGVAAMALHSGSLSMVLDLPRLAVMIAVYMVYFVVFIGVSLTVSAQAPSSRTALVILLSFWFFNCLIAARLASDMAKAVHPAPSAIELDSAIAKEAKGHGQWDDQVKAVTTRLMAQHNVTDARLLPVNPEAIALDQGERRDALIYEKHFNRLNNIYQSQYRVYQAGAIVAPLLAVQSLSMGLSGTDLAQHRHFSQAAEQYRRTLVNRLNEELIAQGNSEMIWDFKGDRSLWEKVAAFRYTTPGLGWVLGNHRPSLAILVFWLFAVMVVTPLAVARVRID